MDKTRKYWNCNNL